MEVIPRNLLKHANLSPIGANSLATANIPAQGTIYAIFLKALTSAGAALTRAQILADIGTIVIRVDGKPYIEGDVQFFLDRQKYYGDSLGAGNVDGEIPIFLTLPHLESDAERRVLGWGMADVENVSVEVEVDAVAQLSTLELRTLQTSEPRVMGRHIRIRKFPQNFSATGEQDIDTLARENGKTDYLALHLEEGSGTIDEVTIKVNNVELMSQVDPSNNQVLIEPAKRTPQSGYFHVDFGIGNDLTSILPMVGVKDFRQKITWNTAAGAPGVYNIYAEMLFNSKQD